MTRIFAAALLGLFVTTTLSGTAAAMDPAAARKVFVGVDAKKLKKVRIYRSGDAWDKPTFTVEDYSVRADTQAVTFTSTNGWVIVIAYDQIVMTIINPETKDKLPSFRVFLL